MVIAFVGPCENSIPTAQVSVLHGHQHTNERGTNREQT